MCTGVGAGFGLDQARLQHFLAHVQACSGVDKAKLGQIIARIGMSRSQDGELRSVAGSGSSWGGKGTDSLARLWCSLVSSRAGKGRAD